MDCRTRNYRLRHAILTIATLMSFPTWPCGPDFPFAYVWQSHPEFLLNMPEVDFYQELAFRFDPNGKDALNQKRVRPAAQLDLECDEFQRVLGELPRSPDDTKALVHAYRELRRITGLLKSPYKVSGLATYLQEPVRAGYAPNAGVHVVDALVQTYSPLLKALPTEFSLYAEAAIRYRLGDFQGAIKGWDTLLSLEPAERQYRSVWAAFMLGKIYLQLDPPRAVHHFEHVRTLAAGSFTDPLALAIESLGWQAQAEALSGDYQNSILHYVEQLQQRNPRVGTSSYRSLHYLCRQVCRTSPIPESVVFDPLARDVVTLWILSRKGTQHDVECWTEALTSAPYLEPSPYAGRLAQFFYENGSISLATQWTALAAPDDAIVRWVQAKLHIRAGEMEQAESLLTELTHATREGNLTLPHNCGWRDTTRWHLPTPGFPENDLGGVRLERDDYAGALSAFLDAGSVYDATYVAEQVMTSDELATFLETHPKDFSSFPENAVMWRGFDLSSRSWQQLPTRKLLQYALARKLARQGDYERARLYYPETLTDRIGGTYESPVPLLEIFDQYATLKINERNRRAPDRTRAKAIFDAAFVARKWGMELLGTEHAPDWRLFDGHYTPRGKTRLEAGTATPLEAERVRANQPKPNQRYHYRVENPQYMWEVAQLLPDNDELTAQALWYGGKWAQRAGGDADTFYKALVRRCRKLPIGKAADERRWFPPKPDGWP